MFCHTDLGSNEAIEHFPVGRRLAFDAAKGRLWAVCTSCERWNLSPVEERWEAIEECEKHFRNSRLRVSTDNIGLAKLKEGTTLVRVGDPQRPEMAAWRYGDQFHRRRRKHLVTVAGGAVLVGGVIVAGPILGLLGGASFQLWNIPNMILQHRTVAKVPVNGSILRLNRRMLKAVSLRPIDAQGFVLEIPHKPLSMGPRWRMRNPEVVLQGDEALHAARHLLPAINRAGAGSDEVARAVGVLETAGDTEQLFSRYAFTRASARNARGFFSAGIGRSAGGGDDGRIARMPRPVRLALEMSLHEDDERRALDGELMELEDRWREAEEVAAIADDMFLPAGVASMLDKLKGGRS